eukprot:4600725-Amphidinium_carterae.1
MQARAARKRLSPRYKTERGALLPVSFPPRPHYRVHRWLCKRFSPIHCLCMDLVITNLRVQGEQSKSPHTFKRCFKLGKCA